MFCVRQWVNGVPAHLPPTPTPHYIGHAACSENRVAAEKRHKKGSSRNGVISQLQNLSHYPALATAGRRMPDDRRLHSKPENLGPHALCAKCITRLLPE